MWRPATTLINGAKPKSQMSRETYKFKTVVTVIVQHEIKDFAFWKNGFDADKPKLVKAGIKLMGLYTSVNNPNDVTMIFESPDAALFNAIMGDPERQKAIEEAGATTEPKISILNKS